MTRQPTASGSSPRTEVDEGIWLVDFMHNDLGDFEPEPKALQPIDNPNGTRLSPMSSVRFVTHVSGPDKRWIW